MPSPTPVTRTTRAADGCVLSYTVGVNPGKPRIAFVHSLAMSHAIWREVVGEIQNETEVLLFDCRGHGDSERRPGPYTLEGFAQDLSAIFDACQWESSTIAGCSMGGCVAQAFAAAYPARVRSLALIDTTSWYGQTALEDWNGRSAKAAANGLASMVDFQLNRWFSDGFREAHPDRTQELAEIFRRNDIACYQAACEMLAHADVRTARRSFRMPVAVIVGEEDYATPLHMARDLHEAVTGSTLTVIAGGRHLTPVQCPVEIAAVLRLLLDDNRSGTQGR